MTNTKPEDWLFFKRCVRFGETDAAGVIHFHHLFRWCHEAWEESIEKYGISVFDVFPTCSKSINNPEVALPIVHCEADFRAPIKTGDCLNLILIPRKIDSDSFQVQTKFQRLGSDVAIGLVSHMAINAKTRQRCDLPESINFWLEASSLNLRAKP